MNISAVNCTPIKPQVASFKGEGDYSDKDFDALMRKTDEINDKYINSSNIKKPLAVVATVAIAAILAFNGGKRVAGGVKEFINKLQSKSDKPFNITNPQNVEYFENKLKKFSTNWKEKAIKLQSEEGKLPKIKKAIGLVLEKAEDTAKLAYKKITNIGITQDLTPEKIGEKKFENLGGAIGVGVLVPSFSSQDNNGDGVSDAIQKNQSAYNPTSNNNGYENTKGTVKKALEGVGVIGELIQTLT